MSEIRENRLTGEWVIIAPERARRGGAFAAAPERAEVPPFSENCPFCPGHEAASEERFRVAGPDGQWLLRSVVNKFSVLSPFGETVRSECSIPGEVSVNGVGLHEVVIESPLHNGLMAAGDLAQYERIIEAWRQRFVAFYADARVRHVIIFKNHGADAGASQQHPHSQIVGLPIVPGQVRERMERSRRFREEIGQCLACTLIEQERQQGCRLVAENDDFVAFIPYAALSPYHLWIFPKNHAACFSGHPALPAFAEILRAVLAKVHGLLGDPPFNLILRSLGPGENGSPYFHWYLSLVARVNKTAGFELGTGMYVNPSLPENCARALREFAV